MLSGISKKSLFNKSAQITLKYFNKNNMKKNTSLIILFIFLTLILLPNGFIFALEVPFMNLTDKSSIGEYVSAIFNIIIAAAGIISLISFTVGAVGLIASAGSAEAASGAKDRMRGAVLGLVLTMSAFIILRTINPAFITPGLTPLPGVSGVFYYNGSEKIQVGSEDNVINRPKGFDQLIYCCDADCKGGLPMTTKLLIWEFPKAGWEEGNPGLSGVNVKRKNCGEVETISGLGSFRLGWETSGIYFSLGKNCQGYRSEAITGSQNNIPPLFDKKIQSIWIVNDLAKGYLYGAVFHKVADLNNEGSCTQPILNETFDGVCENINIEASAADIFIWNKKVSQNNTSSGDGVEFFSEPFGWDMGANAGRYEVPDLNVGSKLKILANRMRFNYSGVDRPDEYKCSNSSNSAADNSGGIGFDCISDENCNINAGEYCYMGSCISDNSLDGSGCCTFQDCPGSIKIKGSYLVGLYSKTKDQGGNYYCQTFTSDVENLNAEPLMATSIISNSIINTENDLGNIYIIPIKK